MRPGTILISFSLLLLASGCAGKQTAVVEDRVEQVKTSPLGYQKVSRQLELSTTLEGYEEMSISPSVTGTIEKINVEVGDRVKAGDTLLVMDRNQLNTTRLTYANLSKREILQISRQRAKLDKNLGSIADLTRLPSALFVVDVMKENIAVREANRLGIPVFAIVDTNSDPNNVDFVIPANDDANKSIEVILDACCGAIAEGLEERKAEKVDMEAAGEAPKAPNKKKGAAKARLDKSTEAAINASKAAAFMKDDEEA